MYLWDLEIEKIPCPWWEEEWVQKHIRDFPNGEHYKIETGNQFGDKIITGFIHPAACRRIIIDAFNKAKSPAQDILMNQNKFTLKEFIAKIIEIDAIIFELLDLWTGDWIDESSLDPKDILPQDEFLFEIYFDDKDNQFNKYKLIVNNGRFRL